jgi:hypothetical protein
VCSAGLVADEGTPECTNINDNNIGAAVNAWISGNSATYGDIKSW